MFRSPSVSRRLLLSVAVPLVLFFGLTVAALDIVFRNSQQVAMREVLNEQIVALVTAAEMSATGQFEIQLLDPESRLDLPGSGQYAVVRDQDGQLLWGSTSLQGTGISLGGALKVGETQFRHRAMAGGGGVAELDRGLQWDYALGRSKKLVFSVADSTGTQQRQLQLFRRQLVGWFTVLALLLLGLLALLMRRALAPVRRLEREIGAVERGELRQLGGDYPRELAGVTDSLNALLAAERNRIARYRDTLGNLAHSLKTPLAVIRGALDGMHADAGAGAGSATDGLIGQQVGRMAQIVEHQLKRAATGGGATLGQAPVPLLVVAAELRAALLRVHADKDLLLDLEIGADPAFLGDRGDITELLGNLMDNACKWCRGRVRVTARVDVQRPLAQRLALAVEDDGPGVAAADRERVIERGVRADEHVPGHGLGLAMVGETVALYGGQFRIGTSQALGGAQVLVLLPGR